MRALLIGAACAAPMLVPLSAQNAVLRTLLDRDRGDAPPARLVVVDAKGSRALADGFSSLLSSETLRVYAVPVQDLAMGGAETRAALAKQPQWFLLEAKSDAVLAGGMTLPSPAALAQILERAGFRDRARELRAYLKRDPDSLEARDQLLSVLRQRGEAAALRFLGVQVESPEERLERGDEAALFEDGSTKADLSKAKPLNPVQDLEAWSAFTGELDAAFRGGQWRELDQAWLRGGRPLDEASPTLQGLYLRWMPEVEAALREDPSSESLWALWCWMSQATGGHRLGPLLASLQPSPLTPKGDWPPPRAARLWLETAKTPADWAALKAHYEAVWEEGFHSLRERSVEKSSIPWERDWSEALAPLIESCLRSGDAARAESLLRGAMSASAWSGLSARASALAARCGKPALAKRWAAWGAAR